MQCPKCKKEIEKVYVVSDYTQEGVLKGNKITDYNDVPFSAIGTTNAILCPLCDSDISNSVEE